MGASESGSCAWPAVWVVMLALIMFWTFFLTIHYTFCYENFTTEVVNFRLCVPWQTWQRKFSLLVALRSLLNMRNVLLSGWITQIGLAEGSEDIQTCKIAVWIQFMHGWVRFCILEFLLLPCFITR